MSKVTEEQLAAWEAKAKAVASAPWHRCACGHCTLVWAADRETCIYSGTNDDEVPAEPHAGQIANADFMAAASEALLPLIAEVRDHREKLKMLHATVVNAGDLRRRMLAEQAKMQAVVDAVEAWDAANDDMTDEHTDAMSRSVWQLRAYRKTIPQWVVVEPKEEACGVGDGGAGSSDTPGECASCQWSISKPALDGSASGAAGMLARGGARLDTDGTAKPLTEIVGVMPAPIGDGKTYSDSSVAEYVVRPIEPWAEDGDGEIPEDAAINAAFPTRSGRHDIYGEAMRLVSAKRSKGALVALVNWMLHRAEDSENYAKVCSALGIEYAADGHATKPGPIDVVLAEIRELKDIQNERIDRMVLKP